MSSQNRDVVRRITDELFNQGNLGVVDEVFHPDYVEHYPLPPGFPTGREGVKSFVALVRQAFPDFHCAVDDEIVEGYRIVDRITYRGTQTGEFMGIPATGKSATWQAIHIGRFADGKLIEHWAIDDQLGLLRQLGVIPAGAPASA